MRGSDRVVCAMRLVVLLRHVVDLAISLSVVAVERVRRHDELGCANGMMEITRAASRIVRWAMRGVGHQEERLTLQVPTEADVLRLISRKPKKYGARKADQSLVICSRR